MKTDSIYYSPLHYTISCFTTRGSKFRQSQPFLQAQNLSQTRPHLKLPRSIPQLNVPTIEYSQFSRQITDFIEIYKYDDLKFTGERFDFLNKKLEIFYDFCRKVGLRNENHGRALSIMLSGKALEFYYRNINNRNDPTMQQAVDLIKQHF